MENKPIKEEGVLDMQELIEETQKKMIFFSLRGFNPTDERIRTLIAGFIKKAKELGFHDNHHCHMDSLDESSEWENGRLEWIFMSH